MIRNNPKGLACLLVIAQIIALVVFIPLAICGTTGWSDRLVALGLALEIGGVWGLLVPVILQENPFVLVNSTAARVSMPGFWIAVPLLPVGFALQFVSVVWL